jgi:hypothetical protein
LVVIFVRGLVDNRAIVRQIGLGKLKIPVTSSGIVYYAYKELAGNEQHWCKRDVVPKVILLSYFLYYEKT